ncbi:MAG: ATPase, T2SS/T4P/T4SS family [Peptococcaceae bacterium]|jgi:pilus assembly protein CpaF|nr:ATPase, T2SS/T4P/T4SS family [Peptococcaceae bacterium]
MLGQRNASALQRRLAQAEGDFYPRQPAPDFDRAAVMGELMILAQKRVQEKISAADIADRHSTAARQKVERVVGEVVEENLPDKPRPTLISITKEIVDNLMGYGPLEPFFTGPEAHLITEIIVRKYDHVMVEKNGKTSLAVDERGEPVRFQSEQHVLDVLERMLTPTGRRVDISNPVVGARLPDGSRLQAAIPPVAVEGTQITIRRFRQDASREMLLSNGALNREVLDFLGACVRAKLNIFVSGGTGSGKTTLLNVLSSYIPEDESIITIEDPAELQLQHGNVRRLEARPPNVEGKGEITQRDLVAMALRMAPKRIIVGECRRGETFDMLQAMNTGHAGSMSTGHANSAADMINSRLPSMVQLAVELQRESVLEMIASAVDLVIHMQKGRDGVRRVDHICEVVGLERRASGDLGVALRETYVYDRDKGWIRTAHPFSRQYKLDYPE